MQNNHAPRDVLGSGDTKGHAGEQLLLVTKLAMPPVRADLVDRPRLVKQLEQGIRRPLTLIAAPAGFGKTTLLATWIEKAAVSAAWVSLEVGDDDLMRFWTYVFTAVERVQRGSGKNALALLQVTHSEPLPPIENILTVWINGLAALPQEVVLVLDDYHLITAQAIHRSLTFLLDHLPQQIHLVMATRADPPLPLARLRTRGHLTEIRATALRFTFEEAAAFLTGAPGLTLSTGDIAALQERTEGWIAGLQLAALSMQGRNDIPGFLKVFTGSQRYIIDYLVEEVLARQPEPVQTFLLRTAILERLEGSLCEAVLGEYGEEISGQEELEQLEQANLFLVPLDDERRWFRYHHLFAEALRHRLQRTHPTLVAELHRRASAWYEQHDLIHEAVYHVLAVSEFAQAARLIEQNAERLVKHGELATLGAWLDALPDELVRSRVELGLWHSWLLTVNGQFDAAERLLQELERQLGFSTTKSPQTGMSSVVQPSQHNESQTLIEHAGRIAATRAYIAFRRGDAPRTIALALQALKQLQGDQTARGLVAWYLGITYLLNGDLAAGADALNQARVISQAAGNSYAAFMATFELAQLQARQGGHLHEADQSYRQALELVAERGELLAAAGPAYVGRGELQYEWNNLDTASRYLQEGIEKCQQTGNTVILLLGYIMLTRVKQAQGDAESAYSLMQNIEQILQTHYVPPHNAALLAAWLARLALAQGDFAKASRWVQERRLRADDELSPRREREYLTLARVLHTQQRTDEALPMLGQLLHLAKAQGRMGSVIEILVLQALARQARGDEAEAMEILESALTLAEPEGYIRLFVDEGASIANLLMQMRRRPHGEHVISTHYREQLLALMGKAHDEDVSHSAAGVPGSGMYPFAEPLSEREREVLRLIVVGCSNREIADRLVIAVSTVKWYVNAIYGKLQVGSRTKAIAKARELNIL